MNGYGSMDAGGSGGQVCCLLDNGIRCSRRAGNASYNKRIQKIVQQRRLKLTLEHNVRHIYICDYHKNLIQNLRVKRKRTTSEMDVDSGDNEMDCPEVDFFSMPVNTLRRFKRFYKLQTRPGLTKAQLADMVARHFKQIKVIEKDVLTYFIYAAKNHRGRLDSKQPGENV